MAFPLNKNPRHIERRAPGRDTCDILKQLVEKYPELRVGQIIVIATRTLDVFNMENEEMSRLLNEFLWSQKR